MPPPPQRTRKRSTALSPLDPLPQKPCLSGTSETPNAPKIPRPPTLKRATDTPNGRGHGLRDVTVQEPFPRVPPVVRPHEPDRGIHETAWHGGLRADPFARPHIRREPARSA